MAEAALSLSVQDLVDPAIGSHGGRVASGRDSEQRHLPDGLALDAFDPRSATGSILRVQVHADLHALGRIDSAAVVVRGGLDPGRLGRQRHDVDLASTSVSVTFEMRTAAKATSSDSWRKFSSFRKSTRRASRSPAVARAVRAERPGNASHPHSQLHRAARVSGR